MKKRSKNIKVIVGGAHPTALPEETLRQGCFDAVCVGEGDHALPSYIEDNDADIPGIWRYVDEKCVPPKREAISEKDLDILPLPAYDLLDRNLYRTPKIFSRKSPLGFIETSRGCYGRCIYCNKLIHGHKMRYKSTERVIREMELLLRLGYKDIAILDDCFSADINRAKNICREIITRRHLFPWQPYSGMRVDRIDRELLKLMKDAGCYRVSFGVETGSQRILDIIDKRITLQQAEQAVRYAKEVGLETICFFMIGFPDESEEDIEKTIKFAMRIDPHYVKFPFTIPLPGTRLFKILDDEDKIKTHDWNKYVFSTPAHEIYDHPSLSWEQLNRLEREAYKRFFLRPKYIAKMIVHALRTGTFWTHVSTFLGTSWS